LIQPRNTSPQCRQRPRRASRHPHRGQPGGPPEASADRRAKSRAVGRSFAGGRVAMWSVGLGGMDGWIFSRMVARLEIEAIQAGCRSTLRHRGCHGSAKVLGGLRRAGVPIPHGATFSHATCELPLLLVAVEIALFCRVELKSVLLRVLAASHSRSSHHQHLPVDDAPRRKPQGQVR
jgi:hypothetical protein